MDGELVDNTGVEVPYQVQLSSIEALVLTPRGRKRLSHLCDLNHCRFIIAGQSLVIGELLYAQYPIERR
jgi:hypothetical protein